MVGGFDGLFYGVELGGYVFGGVNSYMGAADGFGAGEQTAVYLPIGVGVVGGVAAGLPGLQAAADYSFGGGAPYNQPGGAAFFGDVVGALAESRR